MYRERVIAKTVVTIKLVMTIGKGASNSTAGISVTIGAMDIRPVRFLEPGVTNCFSPQYEHSTPLLNRRNLMNVFFQFHLRLQFLHVGIFSSPVNTYTILITNKFHLFLNKSKSSFLGNKGRQIPMND